MTKGILSAGLIALFFAASANATTVYQQRSGRWVVSGIFADDGDRTDDACVISTKYADGRTIRVNRFILSGNVTMTVNNGSFSNIDVVNFYFQSGKYGDETLVGYGSYKGPNTVIFRKLNSTFASKFVHSDNVYIFAGTSDEWAVSLEGTAAAIPLLRECVQAVANHGGSINDDFGWNY